MDTAWEQQRRVAQLAHQFYESTDAAVRREAEITLSRWTQDGHVWRGLPALVSHLSLASAPLDVLVLFYTAQAVIQCAMRSPQQWRLLDPSPHATTQHLWSIVDRNWVPLAKASWVRNKLCQAIVLASAHSWEGGPNFAPLLVGASRHNEAGLTLLRFAYECCPDCIADPAQSALTRLLKTNAPLVVSKLCVPALTSKPESIEALQLLLAVSRLEVGALQPSLLALWKSLRACLVAGKEEASLSCLSVFAEILDGAGTSVMILGAPESNEFLDDFISCLDPRLWSADRIGVAVLQMTTLWTRKQMRRVPVTSALVAVVQRFVLLLQVRRWHQHIRLLWGAVIELQLPSILPQVGQALEHIWTLMISPTQVGGSAAAEDGDESDEDDAQEMKLVALQESEAPIQRIRIWLLGPDPVPVSKRTLQWSEVCGAAVRSYGSPVCQWTLSRVAGLLLRWNSIQVIDEVSTRQVEAALSLFGQTADSLMQMGHSYTQLIELLIAAQERQGALSVYGALAATIEFWETQKEAHPLLLRSVALALRDARHPKAALDYALLTCRLLRHLLSPHASALIPASAADLRVIACALLLRMHSGDAFPYHPSQQFPREPLRAAAAAAWLMSQVCEGSVLKAMQVQQLWSQLLDGGQLLSMIPGAKLPDVAVAIVHCLVKSVGPVSQSHAGLVATLEAVTREGISGPTTMDSSHLLQCIEELLMLRMQPQIRSRLEALTTFVVPRVWQNAVDSRPQCVAVAEQMLLAELCQTPPQPLLGCVLEALCSNELMLWSRGMDAFLHVRRMQPALVWPLDKVATATGALIGRLVERNGTQLEKAESVLYSLSHLSWASLEMVLGSVACIPLRDTTGDVFVEALRKVIRQRRLLSTAK